MDERELIARLQKRDEAAFEELIRQYEKKVYTLCFRMCGNSEDAEEAAQDAFLALWRGIDRFRQESTLSTWIYRLATNACIDTLRRRKKQSGSVSLDDEALFVDAVDTSPQPQETVEHREAQKLLQSKVRTAFLHEIRLVDGIYLAGSVQPYHEIIQALQSRDLLQVKTVYTRVYQEPIPYDQQTVERSDLGFGVVETIQQGVDGTQQLTEEITYVNGVQTAAEVVHIDILTPAVPEITARGTHLAPGMTAELDGYTFIWPVPQYKHVSRWMGGSDNHKGADIAAPRGTPIIASASGTVVTATYHNSVFSYGNYVILDHGDGYRTLYAHMSAFAVKQGDVVQQGQIIGYVGDTGYSFGCHCHFEMFGPGGRFSAQLLFPTL